MKDTKINANFFVIHDILTTLKPETVEKIDEILHVLT